MTALPLRCVIDTNVAVTANGSNDGAPASCTAASARALQQVMARGHVFVDDGGHIVAEYRKNLRTRGQPGPGDVFFRWLLTHEWGGARVTRVAITPRGNAADDFTETPPSSSGVRYDPSDRKFLAVAAAHPDHPPILQSFDSKWWGWREPLRDHGVEVHFICADAIEAKYRDKMSQ